VKILPDNAAADIYTQVLYVITDNVLVIIGVLGIAISVSLVMFWFSKATKIRV